MNPSLRATRWAAGQDRLASSKSSMTDVRENCLRVFERIQRAAERSGRQPDSIRLIAVTKTVEPEHILEAVESGIHDVGENRLQEGLAKREALGSIPLTWHFIGHLQTNKAKKVG